MSNTIIKATIKDSLIAAYQSHRDRPYIWVNHGGTYRPTTYGEVIGRAFSLAAQYIAQGIKDEKIAIYAKNSPEWVSADHAAALSSNVSLLIDASWHLLEVRNAVRFIEPKVFIFDHSTRDVAMRLKPELPDTIFLSLHDLPAPAAKVPAALPHRDPHALAKIFFSSGTTSRPKAIMLSDSNMLFGWDEIDRRMEGVGPDDVCYVFLPFHHVYANVIILLYSLPIGCQLYLCSDIANIRTELTLARPTIIHGVPLFYERIYGAIKLAQQRRAERAIKLAGILHLSRAMRRRLFAPIHEALGGNIKYLLSGGARLDPGLRKFFRGVGLNIIAAYASTETSGSLFASVDSDKYDSVGQAYRGVKYRINHPDSAGVGEVTVKGPNVFMGYYDNPEANQAAFDEDGYFLTGDLGSIDDDADLTIVGRKKRMILMSNGENVWPGEIEGLLQNSAAIMGARVYSEGREIKATITIISASKRPVASRHCRVVNEKLPSYARVDHFTYVLANETNRIKA